VIDHTTRYHLFAKCDRCGRVYGGPAIDRKPTRADRAALLAKLLDAGWSRMRPTPTGCLGEYCPACLKSFHRAKAAKKGGAA
jgi:hypothetical protein